MLLWTSAAYRERSHLDLACLRRREHAQLSHDNLYHTVLGIAHTRNRAYDRELDVLAQCRRRAFDHE
jgi:lipid A ethanolaminephosphotransferase